VGNLVGERSREEVGTGERTDGEKDWREKGEPLPRRRKEKGNKENSRKGGETGGVDEGTKKKERQNRKKEKGRREKKKGKGREKKKGGDKKGREEKREGGKKGREKNGGGEERGEEQKEIHRNKR